MKKSIIFFASFFLGISVIAQDQYLHERNPEGIEIQPPPQTESFERYQVADKYPEKTIKSMNGEIWVQDSVYHYSWNSNDWEISSREIILNHNSLGKKTHKLTQDWNAAENRWVNADSSSFAYYPDGSLKSELRKDWNNNTQEWSEDTVYYVENNEDGIEVLYIRLYWYDMMEAYGSGYKYDNKCNDMGNVIESESFLYKYWDPNQKWMKDQKTINNYDSEGNREYQIEQKWDTVLGVWENDQKIEFEYDSKGNRTTTMYQSWNEEDETWVNSSKSLNEYNSQSQVKKRLSFNWNSGKKSWIFYNKSIYEYNSEGNWTKYLNQSWNSDKQEWINFLQSIIEYNSNNQKSRYCFQMWDKQDNEWTNQQQDLYKYDKNGNLEENTYQIWDDEAEIWINNSLQEYFWSSFNIPDRENETMISDYGNQSDFQLYPNPSHGIINIKSKPGLSYQVITIKGQVICSGNISNSLSQINLEQYPKGIYYLQLKNKGKPIIFRKIIVQ